MAMVSVDAIIAQVSCCCFAPWWSNAMDAVFAQVFCISQAYALATSKPHMLHRCTPHVAAIETCSLHMRFEGKLPKITIHSTSDDVGLGGRSLGI